MNSFAMPNKQNGEHAILICSSKVSFAWWEG
jgi:hypothetical protein